MERMSVVVCLYFLVACGGQGLKVNEIDSSVQRPSNVAVYFTVDTADDEPVPGLQADSFRIYEDDRLVSVHESKQTILNPEVAAVHYTLLLVDMSGSVTESGDLFRIIDAASAFAERVTKYQRVAVYAFDGRPKPTRLANFSNSAGSIQGGVRRLDSYRSTDPSTNLNGAVVQALKELDRALRGTSQPLKFGTLVVFTDGSDRAARVSKESLYEALDDSPHDVVVIGVGSEIDEDELTTIGRTDAILTKNREDITSAFEEAAMRIEAYSKRYYLLGYCSPARAGKHVVRVEAEFDGKTGYLEREFNASGFRAPCDPTKKPSFSLRRPRARKR
jgi:hypothetical protein